MARPHKQGLDYFPLDTDFFSNRKVRRIIKSQGAHSTSILVCLLCNIYSEKGYYIRRDDDLAFDIADQIGVSEGCVNEVIEKALKVGFFHEGIYNRYKVLTSEGIQRRFKASTLKRKDLVIDVNYWVIDGNNPINDGNNPAEPELLPPKVHKVKESKEKKSKEYTPSIPQGGGGGDFFNLNLMKKDGNDTQPDADGVKRNLPGLLEKLHKLKIPPEQFNEICELSNNGEIGHPVWEIANRATLAGDKLRTPGLFILSQLRAN